MQPALILSSSLLTDRMLVHSGFLQRLSSRQPVIVWATSARNPRFQDMWSMVPAAVEPFPDVPPIRERINVARHLNDAAWDLRLKSPSRLSAHELTRAQHQGRFSRAIRHAGRAAAALRGERQTERFAEWLVTRTAGNAHLEDTLRNINPDVVLAMNPFWFRFEPPVAATAKRLGIPVVAFIPSWDNISTKSRLTISYSAYCVWSEHAANEIEHYFPKAREAPVHVVGAPQFDTFVDTRFVEPRQDFFRRHSLDPRRPLVTYAVGSPNLLNEHYGAAEFARRVVAGEVGNVQVLIRPHPIHDRAELEAQIGLTSERVRVQRVQAPQHSLNERSQDAGDIVDWVSTFRFSDVVVNLASTVTIDAAIFDHPVVGLDFDPEPGAPNQELVRQINHHWSHFKAVAESGGVWLATSMDQVVRAVQGYLENPSLHRDGRKWIVRHVCGDVDGHAGTRLADAVHASRRQAVHEASDVWQPEASS